jgi:uncharacterized protein
MSSIYFTHSALGASLQALSSYALIGVVVALIVGGMVKGIVSIGVPLVAMPILSHFLPVKDAVLLLSMPIILGNIPLALEGGAVGATVKRLTAPLLGTILGNVVGVTTLIALPPHRAQMAAGIVLTLAVALMLTMPRFRLAPRWVQPVGFVLGFGAALMESIASIPGPLLAMYLIATGATGRAFTKQIAIILVVSIVTLVATFGSVHHANAADLLISIAASLPVLLGIALVRPLRDVLPAAAFRLVVLLFVLAAAIQMIVKAF